MRTQKQIEASRRNGAKSRGPKTPHTKSISASNALHSTGPLTPHGKSISSRNSLRHGLLAASVVLPTEAREGFDALLADLHEELRPETPIEHRLVEVLAVTDWRRMRLWCMETGQLAHALFAQERTPDPLLETESSRFPFLPTSLAYGDLTKQSRALEIIHRYEAQTNREYRRTLAQYHALRAARTQEFISTKRTEPTDTELPEAQ